MQRVIRPANIRAHSRRGSTREGVCPICHQRPQTPFWRSITGRNRASGGRCIPLFFLDALRVKLRDADNAVSSRTKPFYVALGVNAEGERRVLACGLPTTKGQVSGLVITTLRTGRPKTSSSPSWIGLNGFLHAQQCSGIPETTVPNLHCPPRARIP